MKTSAAVIDFGTNKIVTVLAESGAFSRYDIRGTGTVPYNGYQKGEWIAPIDLPSQVKQSIAAAELEAKAAIKEIFVAVPADFIEIRLADAEVNVPEESGKVTEELMDAVQDAAADSLGLISESGCLVHRSPAWFIADGGKKTMQPLRTGRRCSTLRALTSFVVAKEEFVRTMREMFASMQITIRGFVSAAFGEAILYIPTEERDKTACLIDVGFLNTEISVVEGDAIVYHKVLPIGSGFMMADLMEYLNLDMDTAEELKREFSFRMDERAEKVYSVVIDDRRYEFTVQMVAGAMARTMDELLDGMEDALREAGTALSANAKIYLTGGGLAPMKGAAEWLSEKLGRTVKEVQTNSNKLGGAWYASTHGVIDQVFEALEPRTAQEDSLPGKFASGVKNLFRKEDKTEQESIQ